MSLLPGLFGCRTAPGPGPATQPASTRPIDVRLRVAASQFKLEPDGIWATGELEPEFPFDELIYCWHLRVAHGQGFRLYLRVRAEDGQYSPWLYGDCWGHVKHVQKRTEPVFAWGKVAMDQLLLQRKAESFQFKVVDEGDSRLDQPPSFSVVTTDNSPTPALARRFAPATPG